jgi:hypothetical protein
MIRRTPIAPPPPFYPPGRTERRIGSFSLRQHCRANLNRSNNPGRTLMIELGYDSKPDEYGIHDGRDLARQLIADAYKLLIPYGRGCSDCTDHLFSAVARQAMQEARQQGMPSIVLWDRRPGIDKPTAAAAHVRKTAARTGELLATGPRHEHGSPSAA